MKKLNKILKQASLQPEDIAKQITRDVPKDELELKIHQSKMKRLRILLGF
jgi:hypothetical protein